MVTQNVYEQIYFIHKIVEAGDGDTGRLNFIKECLENQKPLFKSDRKYLEGKLATMTPLQTSDPVSEDLLMFIRELIELGKGDHGRLEHIYATIEKGKKLFKSDQLYLDEELKSKEESTQPSVESETAKITKTSTTETNVLIQETAEISKLKTKLAKSDEKILNLEKTLEEKKLDAKKPTPTPEPQKDPEPKLRGVMPKDCKSSRQLTTKTEVAGIYESLKSEKEKIEEQKRVKKRLDEHQSTLTQIALNRKEFERQVAIEKRNFELKIEQERKLIEEQTRLAEEIKTGQKKLDDAKLDREKITKELKNQEAEIKRQIKEQEKELEKTRTEHQKTAQKVQKRKEKIEQDIKKERQKLVEQDQLMGNVISHGKFLEEIQKQREEIEKQVQQEAAKLSE